jgi:integrase
MPKFGSGCDLAGVGHSKRHVENGGMEEWTVVGQVTKNIKNLTLHDNRRTAATRMALKTGNAFLVQALTGHKT